MIAKDHSATASYTRLLRDAVKVRRGLPDLRHLVADPEVADDLAEAVEQLERAVGRFERERLRLLTSESFGDTSPRNAAPNPVVGDGQ